MPTISTHLPETTYKHLRARIGRRQNASSFVRVAIEEKLAQKRAGHTLTELQRTVTRLQELLEDEIDIRAADQVMAKLERGEMKTYTGGEVWRELGI